MPAEVHRFGVIRVRPASAEAEGPTREALDRLIRILDPSEPSGHIPKTYPFPLDSSPMDDELVGVLAEALRRQAVRTPNLLIDLCYDRTIECYRILEWIVYRSIKEAGLDGSAQVRIYVFLEILPGPGERLANLSPAPNVYFIDSEGETLGFGRDSAAKVEDSLTEYLAGYTKDLPELFRRRLLRRRGVFATSSDPHVYYKFQYRLLGRFVERELIELLVAFFDKKSIRAVVCSDSDQTAPWLESCVLAAAERVGIPWTEARYLDAPAEAVDPALRPYVDGTREQLRSADTGPVCLLVPAYKNGRGYAELLDTCAAYGGHHDFVPLAVIMDESRVTEIDESDWFGTVAITIGRQQHIVHYLCAAPIVQLDADHWSVQAAGPLGQIEGPAERRSDVRSVAIWSLLNDYPVGLEDPHPKGRAPVRWFPLLRELSDWDSLWIAAALFEEAMTATNCRSSSAILMVIPKEPNASTKIARALEHRLGVAVVQVAREVVDGEDTLPPKDARVIRSFAALRVVVVDESSVTGGTLDRLSRLVRQIRGSAADLGIALLHVSSGPVGGSRHRSIFHWEPYLIGDGHA